MEFGDPASGVDLIPDHDPVQWDSVDLSSQAPAMDTESLHHEPEHHKMSYQCPICDDSFTSRVEYEKHVLDHDWLCTCNVTGCAASDQKFTTPQDLERHMKRFHWLDASSNSEQPVDGPLISVYPHSVYESLQQVPFQHIDHIGHGGSGLVDSVQREGKKYARKTFFLSRTQKPVELEGVLQEVKIAGSLIHDHIVRLVETYQRQNTYAIIMEPVAEGNLATYLSDLDEVPWAVDKGRREQLAEWFYSLATAIAYLHGAGVIHRDIKPQNILTLGGNVLVTDFGISQEFQDTTKSESTELLGTRMYRSPERQNRRRSGRREDIFSLGTVFLEMLTVYSGPRQLAKLHDLLQGPYCHNLDNVVGWIHGLFNEQVSYWFPAMLSVCGLMLEEKRTDRPYTGELLAFWEYRISLAGYGFPWLPIKQTICDQTFSITERKSCESWPEVLRKVSAGSKWMPDNQRLLAWIDSSSRWYSAIHPRIWSTEKAGKLILAALGELTHYNNVQIGNRIFELLPQLPTHGDTENMHVLVDNIVLRICQETQEVELYLQLCDHLSASRFARFATQPFSDSAFSRFNRYLVTRCVEKFDRLDKKQTSDSSTIGGDLFTSLRGQEINPRPRLLKFICERLYRLFVRHGSSDHKFMSDDMCDWLRAVHITALMKIRIRVAKALYLSYPDTLDAQLKTLEEIFARDSWGWRTKGTMEDLVAYRKSEWEHRDWFCPPDSCHRSANADRRLRPFDYYDSFEYHVLNEHYVDERVVNEDLEPQMLDGKDVRWSSR